jgi:hypothetical protein
MQARYPRIIQLIQDVALVPDVLHHFVAHDQVLVHDLDRIPPVGRKERQTRIRPPCPGSISLRTWPIPPCGMAHAGGQFGGHGTQLSVQAHHAGPRHACSSHRSVILVLG